MLSFFFNITCFFYTFAILPKLSMCLEHINNLAGVPHNPPSRTLGPNKQPSADNLFHHAPANTGRECLNVCVCLRETEREVDVVQGHEHSIKHESREYPPTSPPPCVHQGGTGTCPECPPKHTHLQWSISITAHQFYILQF